MHMTSEDIKRRRFRQKHPSLSLPLPINEVSNGGRSTNWKPLTMSVMKISFNKLLHLTSRCCTWCNHLHNNCRLKVCNKRQNNRTTSLATCCLQLQNGILLSASSIRWIQIQIKETTCPTKMHKPFNWDYYKWYSDTITIIVSLPQDEK